MESQAAQHILDVFYHDIEHPIVQHHIDSFNDLLTNRIPTLLRANNPQQLLFPEENRAIRVYIGGRDGSRIGYSLPVDELGNAVLPNTCRLENKTYSIDVRADIEVEYEFSDGRTTSETFEKVPVARIPLMLKSKLCYLSALDSDQLYEAGECRFELGGYFIIDGAERVLLTQERLGNNLFYTNVKVKTAIETGEEEKTVDAPAGIEKVEYTAGIRSISEDGTKGPFSHYVVIPPERNPLDPYSAKDLDTLNDESNWANFRTSRVAFITLPGFNTPVPLLSVFRCLGYQTDKELYDLILAGIPVENRDVYNDLFIQLVESHDRFLKKETSKEERLFENEEPDMYLLRRAVRTRSADEVIFNLTDQLFPHAEPRFAKDAASTLRHKSYNLGYLTRLAMETAIGLRGKTDRDHFRFKRFDVSGDLCFQEFKRVYKIVARDLVLELGKKIEYNRDLYAGDRLSTLVKRENIGYFWKYRTFLNEFSKSFKGRWGGKDGVSQILNRISYAGAISHLRRSSLQMDQKSKILNARRLHGSSYGFTCPTDVPDGRNVGMIKHFALLTNVSTGSPSDVVLEALKEHGELFAPSELIHPTLWNPSWTRVFLNGDILGALVRQSDTVYEDLLTKRRTGRLDPYTSIAWNRETNELILACDQGRPCRPLYRPGVTLDRVLPVQSWGQLKSDVFDFVDAEECDTIKIDLNSFSAISPSEVHGYFMLSPLTGLIPFSDHNQSPRNAFNCAQVRQTASWFSSNFSKRFDTLTLMLNSPTRPLVETWGYQRYMGNGGCMPYGENIMVAMAVYSGYNQDDSVLINKGSLKRGMFHTTYYHSYTAEEESAEQGMQMPGDETVPINHTTFANLLTDPQYADVKRKDDADYSLLDANGIIKLGSEVSDDTVLVGCVVPLLTPTGTVKGYRDASFTPKRGQRGRVDGIQTFLTSKGLKGVKIRIAEARQPTLGDKFGSRHGQKGTCGMIVPEEDMPFTAKGVRPDLIMNPHAIPSRMTVGQLLEVSSTKIGSELGCIVDGTPFTSTTQVEDYRNMMVKLGFEPYGNDILYNGMTGEMLEVELFFAPTYYLCMKHMVEDKINYRDTGPRTLMTHQPVEGRSNHGGMRIGEMERDALIAHGASVFIEESFMKRSDAEMIGIEPELGVFDTKDKDTLRTYIRMPYAMALFTHELESMHIRPIVVASTETV